MPGLEGRVGETHVAEEFCDSDDHHHHCHEAESVGREQTRQYRDRQQLKGELRELSETGCPQSAGHGPRGVCSRLGRRLYLRLLGSSAASTHLEANACPAKLCQGGARVAHCPPGGPEPSRPGDRAVDHPRPQHAADEALTA